MLLDLLRAVSLSLACIGAAYYALSAYALSRHFRITRSRKHSSDCGLSVSVLKPAAGLDAGAQENFESYLHQDYPDYEVLFGTLSPDDEAASVIESIASSSGRVAFYIGCDIEGSNNKVRILHYLAKQARGDVLVITDADTHVSPDFLRRVTAPFSDPDVGVVTCLYKGICPRSLADALESLHMSTVWSPSVASAEALSGISFGLGAAIAVRRDVLRKTGGFESIADYLADDFHLGRRAYMLGCDVVLSDYVIDIVLSGCSLRELLTREVRWSRTTRVSNPAGYIGYGVTFGFAWAVSYLLLSSGLSPTGIALAAGVAAARGVTAAVCATLLGDKGFFHRAWLIPARDLLSFATWVSGLFRDTIMWRGRRLRLLRNGTMTDVGDKILN